MEENLQKSQDNIHDKSLIYLQLYMEYYKKWRDLKKLCGDQKYLDYIPSKKEEEEKKESENKLNKEEIELYSIIGKFTDTLKEHFKTTTIESLLKDIQSFIVMIFGNMEKSQKDIKFLENFKKKNYDLLKEIEKKLEREASIKPEPEAKFPKKNKISKEPPKTISEDTLKIKKPPKEDPIKLYLSQFKTEEDPLFYKYNEEILGLMKSPNISPLIPTKNYAEEYTNPEIKEKILVLSKDFPFYRQIRGDGNCFFRAFGFNFLENMFKPRISGENFKKHAAIILNEKINKENYEFLEIEDCDVKTLLPLLKNKILLKKLLKNLIICLIEKKISLEKQENSMNERETNNEFVEFLLLLMNEKPLFDLVLVLYIRTIVLDFFENNKENPELMPYFFDFEDKLKILMRYGEEADNTIVPLAGFALNKRIVINMLHTDYKQKKTIILTQRYPDNEAELENCFLFFRPGHYDIFYQKNMI